MTDYDIAINWLQNCRDAIAFGSSSATADKTFWAYEKLDELCSKEPLRALKIVREIFELNPEERVIANLAAGPLEDLLVRHGLELMPHLRQYIRENKELSKLLEGVWIDKMDTDVQLALEEIVNANSP